MAEIHKKPGGFKRADDFLGNSEEDEKIEKEEKIESDLLTDSKKNCEAEAGIAEDTSKDAQSDSDKTEEDANGKSPQEFIRSWQLMKMSGKRKSSSGKSYEDNKDGDIHEIKPKPQRDEKDIPYGYAGLFGARLVVPKILLSLIKIIIPVIAVLICRIYLSHIITDTLDNRTNIDATFVCSGVKAEKYIDINGDGTYFMSNGSEGTWKLDTDVFEFVSDEGVITDGRYIERKYIILLDNDFYSGTIAQEAQINTTLTSKDGSTIRFDRDGNVFVQNAGFEEKNGTYVIDGSFITVTLENEKPVKYIKCSDGINKVYYHI